MCALAAGYGLVAGYELGAVACRSTVAYVEVVAENAEGMYGQVVAELV